MARALATQRRAVWAELLQPEQMGVGVRGGTEMMVHGTRGLLADHPDWVAVSTDCRNAYNSVSRGAMLRQLFAQDPAVARFVMFFYGQDAELLYGADDGIETIFSRTGSQQGDPLAGLLFSLAIQPVLAQVQATAVGEAEGARVLAQIDDVYLVGPREWAAQAYAQMTAAYADIDLAMRDDKGRIFSPRGIAVQHTAAARGGVDGGGGGGAALRDMGFGAAGVPVVAHGVRGADGAVSEQAGLVVVGAAVGPLQFQRTHARQAYGDSARLLSLLMVVLMDPQVGCLLVRHCVLTRITYAQRTLLPAAHDGAAESHVAEARPSLVTPQARMSPAGRVTSPCWVGGAHAPLKPRPRSSLLPHHLLPPRHPHRLSPLPVPYPLPLPPRRPLLPPPLPWSRGPSQLPAWRRCR